MKIYFKKIFIFIFMCIIIELIINIFNIKNYIFPAPSSLIVEFIINIKSYLINYLYTFIEAITGLLIAIIVSFVFIYIIIIKSHYEKIILNLLIITQIIPVVIVAPLLLIWFGFGMFSKILLCTFVCIFPIVTSMTKGMKTLDENYILYFETINASKLDKFIHLYIPYLLPYFFSGLKICATYCFSTTLIAEYMGSSHGLGVFLSGAITSYNYEAIYVIAIIIYISTILFLKIAELLQKIFKYSYKGAI